MERNRHRSTVGTKTGTSFLGVEFQQCAEGHEKDKAR